MPQPQIIKHPEFAQKRILEESSASKVTVVDTEEGFLALKDVWNRLNDASVKGVLFTSWEWLFTWWEVYKNNGRRELFILTYVEAGEIKAIAPFQIAYNPRKYFPCNQQIIMLGTGETDGSFVFGEYMDLIIQPGNEEASINAFSDYILNTSKAWDGLKFHELLKNSYLSGLFNKPDSKLLKRETPHGFRTYIDLPSDYKSYLMGLRKKMRNNITRTLTRLNKEQDYSIDAIENEKKAVDAIVILAELNRSRRDNLGKESAFQQQNFEEFHKRLVKRLLPLNKISLRIIRFGDQPVAALYSFIDKETIHPYQSGFEKESGHRYSLLTTMLANEIKSSIENPRISRFNFMYSDEENTYKKRYSGTTETMYALTFDKPGLKYIIYTFIHHHLKSWVKRLLNK